jgi:hypothetical protein
MTFFANFFLAQSGKKNASNITLENLVHKKFLSGRKMAHFSMLPSWKSWEVGVFAFCLRQLELCKLS